ncbi:CsoS2 family carboxysome shell protein [Thiomicrospira sp. R3]|uniref:CsoS2 family carboxysome shell protein n=1 Tax=Thiomicrospira sp. R3 TaxID=3035472 RepID=UPI00259B97C7|nr:CsoS2 family carboxysome shell protein [Thiomicrospira sp. R3]WFE69719.1 CsoS2 family carboxysome shell protein [Thiomicrospira sp. R3]
MSDNTQALSGRALSRARRQALTKGKGAKIDYAALAQSTSAPVKSSAPARSEPTFAPSSPARSFDVNPQQAILSAGRKASIERRKQQVKGNSSNTTKPTRQPRKPIEPVIEASSAQAVANVERGFVPPMSANTNRAKVNPVKSSATNQPKGRLIARSYRKAACEGKAKLQAKMSQNSALTCIATSMDPDASCRDIARQIREQRATQGKVKATTSMRPSGRMSKKSESNSPSKVGFAMTSHEQEVSGTVLANTHKMTGSQAGSCRVISGTEYTGPDEYQAKCSFKPDPSIRKVAMTSTISGRTVSGTEVGLSESVTGTEPGQCRHVTGTEYMPADQGEKFCGTRAPAGVSKVSQSRTARNQVVSGPSMQKREDMTGTEAGEQRHITGSQYVFNNAPIANKQTREMRSSIMSAPLKSDVSSTSAGNNVSGTNVNFNSPVTGENAGFCQSLTGSEYQSQQVRQERCGDSLTAAVKKSIESQTFNGQKITGDRAGLGGKITGASAGLCKSVTGSSYLSFDATEGCAVSKTVLKPDAQAKATQMNVGRPMTGAQPGPMGLTGAQKGVCQSVSGTAYVGSDHASALCQVSAPANMGDSDFPAMMNQVMPMMAVSMPMHNYGYVPPLQQPENIIVGSEELSEADKVVSRITGDGSDSGHSITGDSWGRDAKVSGTGGRSAKKRNVSIPGNRSAMNAGASSFRPNENPKVSDSPITGSAGNTKSGSTVTVSGGARA